MEIDRDIAREAAEILGTTTLRETIDESMREVVRARRRLELVTMFGEKDRFDFDAAEHAWRGEEVASTRYLADRWIVPSDTAD